jgi:nitrite reductase/ring-hydroxylating ferredoxin subunit
MALHEVRLTEPTTRITVGPDTYLVQFEGESLHVLPGRCPHRGGPLHLGERVGDTVRCPWHGNSVPISRLIALARPAVTVRNVTTTYIECADGACPQSDLDPGVDNDK